jgi:NADP-dependent 3-hydroxy acid dehydrogenase YdfG
MGESRGVAMLVGAGDAIGAAVARRFASGGYTVCICRRDAAKSQALVDELKANGHSIHAFSVDARQEAEVPRQADQPFHSPWIFFSANGLRVNPSFPPAPSPQHARTASR